MKLTDEHIENIRVANYIPLFQNENGAIDTSAHNVPGNIHERQTTFAVTLSLNNLVLSLVINLQTYIERDEIDSLSKDELKLLAKAYFVKAYNLSPWSE